MNQYLDDFGVIKIKNAITLDEKIEVLFDDACEELTGNSIRKNGGAIPSIVGGIERFPKLANYLVEKNILNIADKAFGEGNYLFWGSDLSTFQNSSNWHRDSNNDIPSWKIGIYLDGSYNEDQTFHYIPGTHHVKDSYSQRFTKHLKWPENAGLEPTAFISEMNALNNNENAISIPSTKIQIERGDVIVFDTRGVHAVSSNTTRRLIALSFMPKPHLAGYLTKGEINSENEYLAQLLKMRCASQLIEEMHGRIVRYGQKNLNNIPDELKKIMPFMNFEDKDISETAKSLFKNNRDLAMKVLNKYSKN